MKYPKSVLFLIPLIFLITMCGKDIVEEEDVFDESIPDIVIGDFASEDLETFFFQEEIEKQFEIKEKGFLWPCKDNSDCNSLWCIPSVEGKVCTQGCIEDCPKKDWICKAITIGSDISYLCVPRFLHLCDPCYTNNNCTGDFVGEGGICIDYGGEGKFCGGDCSKDNFCPKGYSCKEVKLPDNKSTKQCLPDNGKCSCSKLAIDLQLSTECYVENKFGKCKGKKFCSPQGGLTACDANTPAEEICDNIDNDCDGKVDEFDKLLKCEIKNEFGKCPGEGFCVSGKIDCKGQTPAPEKCDGIDNDCNGEIDEALCYDGNPCTKDICSVGSGECVYEPIAGPCDDGSKCTSNDHCENGNCVGGIEKNCDDLNPCTDDKCDPGSGECGHINNTKPCDDGNLCTEGDTCFNGSCKSGTPKSCNDNNSCTNDSCYPQSGCVYTPNNGIPCDDGNPCKSGDVCSGGKCVGTVDVCKQQCYCPPPSINLSTCVPLGNIPICTCICL